MATGQSVQKPDVTVRHESSTVAPTTIIPRRLACVVAPLYEIIDATVSGVPNSTALTTTPAFLIGDTKTTVTPTAGAQNVSVQLSSGVVTYALPISLDLLNPAYTLAYAASLLEENIPGLVAEVVNSRLVLETSAKGDSALLKLMTVSNDAYTLLGIEEYEDVTIRGYSSYKNVRVPARFNSLPVDKGDIDQMDVDEDSVRAWLSPSGSTMSELKRDQAVLRHRYNASASSRVARHVEADALTTFPQSRFSHNMRPKDDGDGDGTTDALYARGTNAAHVLFGDDGSDDPSQSHMLVMEAWGDQDLTDPGPYHGVAGDSHTIIYRPSENTLAATLVSVSNTDISVFPTVRILVKSSVPATVLTPTQLLNMVDHVVISATGAVVWQGKIKAVTSAGMDPLAPTHYLYYVTLYNLTVGAAGNASLAVYKNIAAAQICDDGGGGATFPNIVIQTSGVDIVTTLTEVKTALEANAQALVRCTMHGTGSTVVKMFHEYYDLDLAAGSLPGEIKVGDLLEENAAAWNGEVVAVDGAGPTIKLTAGRIPVATDVFKRDDGGAGITYTIDAVVGDAAARMNVAEAFTGGRDPIDFTAAVAGFVADEATCRSALPTAAGYGNLRAALVRIDSVVGTLPRSGLAAFGTSGAMARVLDSGTGYLMLGFNVDGEVMWPQDSETVTVTPEDGGTGATGRVLEFHTVLNTEAVGSTAIVASDTFCMNDAATELLRSYRIEVQADPTAVVAVGDTVYSDVLAVNQWEGQVTNRTTGANHYVWVRLNSNSVAVPANTEQFGVAGSTTDCTIVAGPTAPFTIPDYNEWTSTVVRATRIETPTNDADREYRLVLKNMSRTTAGTTPGRGLPGVQTGAGNYGISLGPINDTAPATATEWFDTITSSVDVNGVKDGGGIAAHSLKTIPTAGTSFYLSVSGSSWAQVNLAGDEFPSGTYSIESKINDAVSDEADLFAATSGAYMLLDVAQLPAANPYAWRDGVGGQESTIVLRGDGIPYVFGRGHVPDAWRIGLRTTHRAFDSGYDFTSMHHFGVALATAVGDEIYDGSTLLGVVSSVDDLEIGGQTFTGAKLVIDRELTSYPTSDYSNWGVLAKDLTEDTVVASYGSTRPYPQFAVYEALQQFHVMHDVMRNSDWTPPVLATSNFYVSYRGLRLDVTPSATLAELQYVSDEDTLLANYGPIRPANPLAWGLYTAMQNGRNRTFGAMGVAAVSDDQPMGTTTAHSAVADFLQVQRGVYAVAVPTYDSTVRDLWQLWEIDVSTPPTLDDTTSSTEKRSVRVLLALDDATEAPPTSMVSGTAEDGSVTGTIEFAAGVDLRGALVAAGVDPDSTPTEFRTAQVYIDCASDAYNYLVQEVDGQTVTLNITHAPGANTDGFWATAYPDLADGGETCTMKKRGAAASTSTAKSVASAAEGNTFGGDDRLGVMFPGRIVMPYNGSDNVVDGYWLTCVVLGWMAVNPPIQGFTNMRAAGVTGVYGSNDTFTDEELNLIAGGGSMIFYRPDPNSTAVVCRHQLTNDVSDEIKKQFSIRTQKDALEWALRASFKPVIGKRNVTKQVLAYYMSKAVGVCNATINRKETMPGTRPLAVYVDGTRQSRVIIRVRLVYAMPNDYIDITIIT